jgi:hypothetical protein
VQSVGATGSIPGQSLPWAGATSQVPASSSVARPQARLRFIAWLGKKDVLREPGGAALMLPEIATTKLTLRIGGRAALVMGASLPFVYAATADIHPRDAFPLIAGLRDAPGRR